MAMWISAWILFIFATIEGSVFPEKKQDATIVFPNSEVISPMKLSAQNSPFNKAVKSVHYGAARLLELTREETQSNWVVSPISLAAILGQLMLGARGHFRTILGDILTPGNNTSLSPGLDVHQELGALLQLLQDEMWTDYVLHVTSALFIQPDIKLKLSYKHALMDIYNVNVFKADFANDPVANMKKINAWVRTATFGKISDIINMPVSPTTASLYINTVYFKGSWQVPFDPALTSPSFFSLNLTHQVPVDFMAGEMEVKYVEDENCRCRMIGIPYEGSSIFLYIFLPNKDESGTHYRIYDFAAQLSPDRMTELVAAAKLHNVTVILPKVKLSSTLSLRKPMARALSRRAAIGKSLNGLRMRNVGSEDPDLSAIVSNSISPLPLKIDAGSSKESLTFNMGSASDDYRFKIDDVLHKVQLEMNENGLEAVAVTSTLVDYFGGLLFRADRPFLFMIRHEYTGVHLFWGAIYNPENLK